MRRKKLSQSNRLRIAEVSDPGVNVLSPDSKMILVALRELGQGAGHGQGQGLDVSDFFPKGLVGCEAALLVGVDLVGGDGGVLVQANIHVPREDNS